ncbi:Monocarboxylate transporter 7 [Rhizoctonia solani]|uniref:Monocarboxylate transporter 7 n=1 Tax=Rhizoctonia solani TaxID=456999 RepID=A0A0K6FS57_9AGAM|nr:Monocarboxylate transporter 7 [Rhizoctonia solani]
MTSGTFPPAPPNATGNEDDAKTIASQTEVAHQAPDKEIEFPDGGLRAWMVTLGGFAITFSTDLAIVVNSSVTAWPGIPSILPGNHAPTRFPFENRVDRGLVTGRMFDLGYFRGPQLAAAALFVAGTLLTAECKEYWQFLLCQGIAVGIGCGFLFGPMIPVITHWFKARRGVAVGIASAGSSVGGTIIPIVARRLIPMIGFKWTIRVISLILSVVVVIAIITMRRRLPPVVVAGGLFNLKAFCYAPYSLYVWAAMLAWLGLYTVLTYLQVYAKEVGVSPNLIPYLISISNAASFFGRISSGYLSDRIGPLNTIIPSALVTGIATYAWPFARSDGALIAVACIYGGSLGFFTGTWQMPPASMGSVDDVGRRTGMLMSIITIGAVAGPPSSGAIRDATGSFKSVGYYAGSIIVLCVLSMIGVKYATLGRLTGKM